jgi:fibrillarin-like rRNA methylase
LIHVISGLGIIRKPRETAMSSAITTAVNGINKSVAQATQAASNIANASLTGKNIDGDAVKIKAASTDVAANAAVIRAEKKNQKALLDILV